MNERGCHRLTGIRGPSTGENSGGELRFGYTGMGGVSRLILGCAEAHFDYDAMGRATSQTLLSPVQRKHFETTYYPDGKVHSYTIGGALGIAIGAIVVYIFQDSQGRIKRI